MPSISVGQPSRSTNHDAQPSACGRGTARSGTTPILTQTTHHSHGSLSKTACKALDCPRGSSEGATCQTSFRPYALRQTCVWCLMPSAHLAISHLYHRHHTHRAQPSPRFCYAQENFPSFKFLFFRFKGHIRCLPRSVRKEDAEKPSHASVVGPVEGLRPSAAGS